MTIVASEIDRFDRPSATWWSSTGPMRPLHVIDELRPDERFDVALLLELISTMRRIAEGMTTPTTRQRTRCAS